MIGLDTNILARYYIDDDSDEKTQAQHEAARALMGSGEVLMVSKTVLLELEWVMRGHYRFKPKAIQEVLTHLIQWPHVVVEAHEQVERALAHYAEGLDLADSLHLAGYEKCKRMASFDDRRFARRAKRLHLSPPVFVPGQGDFKAQIP